MIRVGVGYDAHRLVAGRDLVLGGVKVPFEWGLEGHSDADVLAHAIADAVLGAAGLGELGEMFPASEAKWRDRSSMDLLTLVARELKPLGSIVNIDAVVIADAPRLREFRDGMRRNIAQALGVEIDRIGIKPKSNEGLGYEGRGEGMSAHAVALVEVGS